MNHEYQQIDHLNNLVSMGLEDIATCERIAMIRADNNLRPHHVKELDAISKRYGGPQVSVEGYHAVSTEGFLKMLGDILAKVGQWVAQVFSKTSETVDKVTTGGTPQAKDIITTQEATTYFEKVINMASDFKNFSALEKLSYKALMSGEHDDALLKELSEEELKAAKKWARLLNECWMAWDSIARGLKDTPAGEDERIGYMLREVRLISTKGIMNAEGIKEIFSANFMLRHYLLVPKQIQEARNILVANATAVSKRVSELEKRVREEKIETPHQLRIMSIEVNNQFKVTSFSGFHNESVKSIPIDDNFINKVLPSLVESSGDFLKNDKVKLDKTVLAAVRPLANESNARKFFNSFNANIQEMSKSDPDNQQDWEKSESHLVKNIAADCRTVVGDYTRFLRDMLEVQRLARYYLRFTKKLQALNLD